MNSSTVEDCFIATEQGSCLQPSCATLEVYIAISLYNMAVITMNIVHIKVLSELRQLKGTNLGFLLKAMSVCDIVYSVIVMCIANCPVQTFLARYIPARRVVIALLTGSLISSLNLIALGMVDRCLAVRCPLKYPSFIMISHWQKSVVCLITFSYLLNFVGAFLGSEETAPLVTGYAVPKGLILLNIKSANMAAVIVIVLTCLVIILYELRKASKRVHPNDAMTNNAKEENSLHRKTALTLLRILVATFIVSMAPLICSLLRSFAPPQVMKLCGIISLELTSPANGWLNTLVYGISNNQYRHRLKQLIGCKKSTLESSMTTTNI